jgi:hypothetical protein
MVAFDAQSDPIGADLSGHFDPHAFSMIRHNPWLPRI